MMISEKELTLLKKSLCYIRDFPNEISTSGADYIVIHERNMATLSQLAEQLKSDFFNKKLKEYPTINQHEVEDYIKNKRKELRLFDVLFGRIFGSIFYLFKKKGISRAEVQRKIIRISEINEAICTMMSYELDKYV